MKRVSITKGRDDYLAEFDVIGDKAKGKLYSRGRLIRNGFNVTVKDMKFKVDIGTGSGVKVEFKI